MHPTDVSDPRYYHKVVDCQWACPAHTNVPAYIRLIAQGRFTESYLLNRASNVFPGVLGRTCDRPCEPACRRGRIDEKPVAICRLKRVAADLRGEIEAFLPKAPDVKNGKRIALIGAGPASLTVANDLLPLGYEVTIFEKNHEPGGLMRINIPSFRLPASVLDDECGFIIGMGAEMRYGAAVTSLAAVIAEGFDAVFVGSGAPKGKELDLPGRQEAAERVHIGIEWLANVHFKHVEQIGPRVIIIGVGNTAMDCCRTAKRLGATDVKVVARRGRRHFKASPWELEDAEEEQVEIIENHAPTRMIVDQGRLVGMEFEVLEWSDDASGRQSSRVLRTEMIPCDDVILAIGQENAFPWIERDLGVEFDERGIPVVDRVTHQSTHPQVFFGGDAAWGPQNIIWAVAHGHAAAISIDLFCRGQPVTDRPPQGMTLVSMKNGLHAWAYDNGFDPAARQVMRHEELARRFRDLSVEVELGFTPEQVATEVSRCLNCDIQTSFVAPKCTECDACIDVCPTNCLTILTNHSPEADLRRRLTVPAVNLGQEIYCSEPLPQTQRVMVKDEDVCLHCGLCAERCPTAAWDMQLFDLIDGNTAAALGAVYAGATVGAWYPITPATSLMEAFKAFCEKYRVDSDSGERRYAILQAEDELAAAGITIGAGWAGARAFTNTSGPGISLMQEFLGLAYYTDIPAVFFDIQRCGPSTGMPTRTQQADILSMAYASHGDTKHPILFPADPGEAFEMAVQAFDLADRLQTPVFVATDLDIGMNDWMVKRLAWDDGTRPDRGKVLDAEALAALPKFSRYLDVDGDGIAARTLPGVGAKGAYFVRGSGHDKHANYTEDSDAYRELVDRLKRKFAHAARLVPGPVFTRQPGADVGLVTLGGCDAAVREAADRLRDQEILVDVMRIRAFPFAEEVKEFLEAYDTVFVIEQNRDGQLRALLAVELGVPRDDMTPILDYGGLPLSARVVVEAVVGALDQVTA